MKANAAILVVDDHAAVLESMTITLEAEGYQVLTALDGVQALSILETQPVDLILADIAMPRMSGLNAVSLIREAVPKGQIVVFSMYEKEAYVHQVLASGVLGYVLKTSSSSEVLEAIRAARRGEYFLSSKINAEVVSTYLKNRKEKPAVRGYDLLSEREQQVFRLMVEGSSTKQIADILCVGPKTVEKYRSGIINKLGIHNPMEMVKYAIKIGIIDPEL